MTATPRVSVVLPTYNRAGTLPRAVESVLAQTFTDFELILVDDGSRDHTAELAGRWQADPRFRYLPMPANSGVCAARNTGIAAARADLVAFQDSDDEWLPDKLERQVRLLGRLPAEYAAVTGAMLRRRIGNVFTLVPWRSRRNAQGVSEVTHEDIREQFFAHVQTLLVRRSALDAVGLFHPAMSPVEDWDLLLRLSARFRVADCEAVVTRGFHSDDSISRRPAHVADGLSALLTEHEADFAPAFFARISYYAALSECEARRPERAVRLLERALIRAPADVRARRTLALLRALPGAGPAFLRRLRRARYLARIGLALLRDRP